MGAQTVSDDQDEIIRVSDELDRMELYGAAQMVLRLARQRDEARRELAKSTMLPPASIGIEERQRND